MQSGEKSLVFEKRLRGIGTSIDDKSKQKAYEPSESGLIKEIEVCTVKARTHGKRNLAAMFIPCLIKFSFRNDFYGFLP